MKFKRQGDTNYYLPENPLTKNDWNCFVFSKAGAATLELETVFNSTNAPFLIVFYTGKIDYSAEASFSDLLNRGRHLIWVQSFDDDGITSAARLSFNNSNKFDVFRNVAFGLASDFRIYIAKRSPLEAVLNFDAASGAVVCRATRGEFGLSANTVGGSSDDHAAFAGFIVPLTHSRQPFGFNTTVEDNFGSILFKTGRFVGRSIQPASPFIRRIKAGTRERDKAVGVRYFAEESFKNNLDLFVTLLPFRRFDNDSGHVSYCEFAPKTGSAGVSWNGTDNFGRNFVTKDFSQFRARLARVVLSDDTDPRFLFIPDHGEQHGCLLLEGAKDGSEMLLGYSGTERLEFKDSVKVVFRKSDRLRVNAAKEDLVDSQKSITSWVEFPADKAYYTDSEKAPLFDNTGRASFLRRNRAQEIKGVETPYAPIKASAALPSPTLPHVPTFSFKDDNEDLLALEQVFSKMRLRKAPKRQARERFAADKKYVTPQGFLTEGNNLHLIKNEGGARGRAAGAGGYNRFTVVGFDEDFTVSISKEDVFFVLTPKLLKDSGSGLKLDAFFSLDKFAIDLLAAEDDTYTPKDEEKIIVLKFSRSSFRELADDPSRWSNWGKFGNSKDDPARYERLKKALHDATNFPETAQYEYFNKVIKNDAKWNGVVVLNIPIGKPEDLPEAIAGLAASQRLQKDDESNKEKQKFSAGLNFRYVAFPVNKTEINDNGSVSIASTSFYGLIDYDLLRDRNREKPETTDYQRVSNYFPDYKSPDEIDRSPWKFLLTKLLVRFENSGIVEFSSFAFLQLPRLFDDRLTTAKTFLTHAPAQGSDTDADLKDNLVRLEGRYQKNRHDDDEFTCSIESEVTLNCDSNYVLQRIVLTKAAFSYVKGGTKDYRFDLDGALFFNPSIDNQKLMSFDRIDLQNIGLKFSLGKFKEIGFDLSRLIVLPKISFDGNGFLKSFPVKFNRLQALSFKPDLPFKEQNFDFLSIISREGHSRPGAMLWGLVFDFDLGTLGDLELLKALRGEILLGWTAGGGLKLGLRLTKPVSKGLDVDLFGVLKLNIEEVNLCSFKVDANNEQYLLRLRDARLAVMGLKLPPDEYAFNGLVFAKPGDKVAWYIAGTNRGTGTAPEKLVLGLGQRVGLPRKEYEGLTRVEDLLAKINNKGVFKQNLTPCDGKSNPVTEFYKPENNWLLASESILPADWPLEIKFIFNDPVLYGIHLGFKGDFLKGFGIDIIYKKLSDNLGVWSLEVQLPNALRNIEMGGAAVTLPNIGIEIYTDGGWRGDIGFPRGSDFSRSCLVQIRPFVGFGGIYIMMARSASVTLFKGIISDDYAKKRLLIVQAGFALRLGLGAYIDKGIFYVGASITVYGVLEGAFAFEKGGVGLQQLFPTHFALVGRVGAIAELVGYVDFKIQKASIYIMLRVEYGLLLMYLGPGITDENGNERRAGLQPVTLYIEGEVRVEIEVTIACFKIFRRRICITVHFSFTATVRFQYTLGGSSSSAGRAFLNPSPKFLGERVRTPHLIEVMAVGDIPMTYVPGVTKTQEGAGGADSLRLVHGFAIPFFGKSVDDDNKKLEFTAENLMRRLIEDIFAEVVAKLPAGVAPTYENLRAVLLTGEVSTAAGDYKVDVQFPNYRPWFVLGHSLTDKRDTVFQKVFKITDPKEVDEIVDGMVKKKDLFRMIPAPILPNIRYTDGDLSQPARNLPESGSGFDITVTNLVRNGSVETVTCAVRELMCSEEQIEKFGSFFDDYKTQFVERQKVGARRLADQPLRQRVIASEYFKLIALLTLEAYFSFGSEQVKKQKDELHPEGGYNPTITAAAISNNDPQVSRWRLNDHLDQIIGQLNYFYNSGLRLPERPEDPGSGTSAYFERLGQSSVFTAASTQPAGQAKVTFSDGKRDGAKFDLTKELFRKEDADEVDSAEVDNFRLGVGEHAGVVLANLVNSFGVEAVRPFELLPVKLAVQNSTLSVKAGEGEAGQRFFPLPEKMRKTSREYRVSLWCAERKNEEGVTVKVTAGSVCVNVKVRVRAHNLKPDHTTRVFELANVNIEDLTLMNHLRAAQPGLIKGIILYHHHKDDLLTPIGTPKVTIVKANLSTETRPPLIDGKRVARTPFNYIADSDEIANFTRLLWEGLTTNNGGYYLLLGKDYGLPADEAEEAGAEYVLTASFELSALGVGVGEKFPPYCNYVRLADAPLKQGEPATIFNGLDKNTHYLYLELFKGAGPGSPAPVLEYHTKMPAHCFGFELSRPKNAAPGAAYSKYLPLEFNLDNKTENQNVLSRDKVLPLMPTEDKTRPGELFYRHVSPLHIDRDKADPRKADPHNIKRYEGVGKDYEAEFALRDAYGFRAARLRDKLLYQHCYFDKLLPMDSWPLLKFSYWLTSCDVQKGELTWALRASFHLRGLLPLVGLDPVRDVAGGRVKPDSMQRVAGTIENVLSNLHTAHAQIADGRVSASVPGLTPAGGVKEFLIGRVTDAIAAVMNFSNDGIVPRPDAGPDYKDLTLTQVLGGFKTALGVRVCIERTGPTAREKYKELSDDVWELQSVESVLSEVRIENPEDTVDPDHPKAHSAVKDLNAVLSKKSGDAYGLGISSNASNEKVIYVIDRRPLRKVKPQVPPDPKANYYGIMPYSNRLWSGAYGLGAAETRFTNVDLDKSLRVVLAKIDELLAPASLVERQDNEDLLDKLILTKKELIRRNLSQKVARVDSSMPEPSDFLKQQFRNLLLEKLNNFYDYDGILRMQIDTADAALAEVLKSHRLTITFANLTPPETRRRPRAAELAKYNVVSSKVSRIETDNKDGEWVILFDQLKEAEEQDAGISLHLEPQITHVEFDIKPIPSDDDPNKSEIESSVWIQLVEPVPLYVVKTDKWPRIVRVFPAKPLITKHEATQDEKDSAVLSWGKRLGGWNYQVGVKDAYGLNDQLEVVLQTVASPPAGVREATRAPEGFIAYWADKILARGGAEFDWKVFVVDLQDVFGRGTSEPRAAAAAEPPKKVVYRKAGALRWERVAVENLPDTSVPREITVPTAEDDEDKGTVVITVSGFNIFSDATVISIKPYVRVLRNKAVENPVFQYRTESVTTPSGATPQIRYHRPVGTEGTLQEVINDVAASQQLSFKSTLKHVLDAGSGPAAGLPFIPVRQMEYKAGSKPTKVDDNLTKYVNGWHGLSLTVYNLTGAAGDLPVFHADLIHKGAKSNARGRPAPGRRRS